jgi:hypothetical protein
MVLVVVLQLNNDDKHAHAGQVNSFTRVRALLVTRPRHFCLTVVVFNTIEDYFFEKIEAVREHCLQALRKVSRSQ